MKKTAYILIALFLFIMAMIVSSCNSYQKQLNTFQTFAFQHNNELAKLCADKFPVIDSAGKPTIDSTKKANNVNYKTAIDSVSAVAADLMRKMRQDSLTSQNCIGIANSYKAKVNELNNTLAVLKNAYHPCKPDTVFKSQTIYRKDQAALSVANAKFTMANDSLQSTKLSLKKSETTATHRVLWIIFFAVLFAASLFVNYLQFRKKS